MDLPADTRMIQDANRKADEGFWDRGDISDTTYHFVCTNEWRKRNRHSSRHCQSGHLSLYRYMHHVGESTDGNTETADIAG